MGRSFTRPDSQVVDVGLAGAAHLYALRGAGHVTNSCRTPLLACPALSILGTGCNSREEAERFAVEAIQEVIESGDEEIEEGADVLTLDVQIAKAS